VPASTEFLDRLQEALPHLLGASPTPCYVYDEKGIIETQRTLRRAFGEQLFRQYFAVKALPNPAILEMLIAEGSGLDCSSPTELELAKMVGASGTDVVFTPNNIAANEYDLAIQRGALITFDDRSALQSVRQLPDVVSFRVAAAEDVQIGSELMGSSAHTKFGVPHHELEQAYRDAMAAGASRFGIHSMILANELSADRMLEAANALIDTAFSLVERLGLRFEYINFGGGLGIPYQLHDKPFDISRFAKGICSSLKSKFGSHPPQVVFECGRSITGPHGVLVTRAVSLSRKASTVVGVDACMSALMRPGIYPKAYHHISNVSALERAPVQVDVVGALCENNDKFGVGRMIAEPRLGDVLLIHDCGAHGHAMGFNYNGRLRPAEFLLTKDAEVVQIRRAEIFSDYIATLTHHHIQRPLPAHEVLTP
jgi:diaminopimelate decarboxylase